jgi:hypothetical protein
LIDAGSGKAKKTSLERTMADGRKKAAMRLPKKKLSAWKQMHSWNESAPPDAA